MVPLPTLDPHPKWPRVRQPSHTEPRGRAVGEEAIPDRPPPGVRGGSMKETVIRLQDSVQGSELICLAQREGVEGRRGRTQLLRMH